MTYSTIPYKDTSFFSKTVLDYLDGNAALDDFYSYKTDLKSVPGIIKNIRENFPVDREILVQTVKDQYVGCDVHTNVASNIDNLAGSNTFTVTTAHQLNIYTGPLYYIYKILNVIRIAKDLNEAYPDYHFVPCYWMGSEDHDFEEVNHLRLFGKKIEWDNFQGGSMGSYSTDGITDLLPSIRGILRSGSHLEELMALMEKAYSQGHLADAVRTMLNDLFGAYGLVTVDGNCHHLKTAFKEVILEELTDQTSHSIVSDQIGRLAAAGYKSKAAPREINLFYIEGRSRNRIIPDGDGFKLADSDRSFNRSELLQIANQHPKNFSPNVILRPLHQQMVLPNIAYIGGGSEVAYWLQLKSLFEHYKVHFPMLLLRTSAQFIAPHIQKSLDKLNLNVSDIFHSADDLKKNYVKSSHDNLDLEDEKEKLTSLFEEIRSKAISVDGSLENWIGAESSKAMKSLDNISKRLIKAGKANNENSMARIDKVKAQLFPEGSLQERYENFMSFYSDKGPQWFDELLEILNPFEKQFYLLH